jgi:flagellar L-ring protein precursor FlgH
MKQHSGIKGAIGRLVSKTCRCRGRIFSGVKTLLVLFSVSVLPACTVVFPVAEPGDPAYAPVITPERTQMDTNPGSIFQPGQGVSLYTDRRASRVGDIVTILLSESTQSSKSAKTAVKKESDLAFDAPNILGTAPSFKNMDLSAELSQSRDFAGEGSSNQSNSLSGSIAVTIADILPNGLYVVKGEKWLTLNNGDEYIRIRGLIRPEDIQPDNSVSSTKVADARISYSGTGDMADSNKMGWASRFFNSRYWPF